MFILTPLEQFQIIPVCVFYVSIFDISLSNSTFIILMGLFFIVNLFYLINGKDYNLFFLPSRFQYFFEFCYEIILSIIIDSIGPKAQKYFPFIFSLFLFILLSNIIGLIPYSFTLTSHLIITFLIALGVFISINVICFYNNGFNFFSLFLPAGSSLFLTFLLVPIEIVSYIFRPISLSVRLFANMMAGHTLLKVIVGFS
jgi:F-type H+-transporting ATPase subunit a